VLFIALRLTAKKCKEEIVTHLVTMMQTERLSVEQDPGKQLSEARRQMAEQRRLMIKALASPYNREQTEAHINMMVKFQNAIDIIDRVNQEERLPGGVEPDRRLGRRTLESSNSS
jgi:hypothetical protein